MPTEPTTRFAAAPGQWAVPGDLGPADQGVTRPTVRSGGIPHHWTTLDLNGDGRLDLVSPAQEVAGVRPDVVAIAQVYGHGQAPHWRVWLGGADGFAAQPIDWPVPAELGVRDQGVVWLQGDPSEVGLDRWDTLDIDGDGRPDLISTATNRRQVRDGFSYTPQVHGHDDAPYWKVWKNQGDGFAAAPTRWPVPSSLGLPDQGMYRLEDDPANPPGLDFWITFDLDGDGRPDVVSTANVRRGVRPDSTATAQVHGHDDAPHWKIWRGEGDGFAAQPARWAVPLDLGAPDQGPHRLRGDASDPGQNSWETIDLDGDGRPDLVSTSTLRRGVRPDVVATRQVHGHDETPHWKVWLNQGDGFAVQPGAWPVPAALGPADQGAAWLSHRPGDAGLDRWASLDLDGDGALDLVSTATNRRGVRPDVAYVAQVHGHDAQPYWKIWRGEGDRFADAPGQWPVPAELGPRDQGLFTLQGDPSDAGAAHWLTLDLDGDGALDVVSPARQVVGVRPEASATTQVHGHPDQPHWRLWRGE